MTSFTACFIVPFITSRPPFTTPEKSPLTGFTLPENLLIIIPLSISDTSVSTLDLIGFTRKLVVDTVGGELVDPPALPVLLTPSLLAVCVLYRNFLRMPFSITTFRRWKTPSLSKLDALSPSTLVASSSLSANQMLPFCLSCLQRG